MKLICICLYTCFIEQLFITCLLAQHATVSIIDDDDIFVSDWAIESGLGKLEIDRVTSSLKTRSRLIRDECANLNTFFLITSTSFNNK